MSRPMRARGLKRSKSVGLWSMSDVAPHAGAWIETLVVCEICSTIESRPMRARGLKQAN